MLFFSETKPSPTVVSKREGKEQVLQCLHGKISPVNLVHWHVISQLPGRKPKQPIKNPFKTRLLCYSFF